MTSAERTESSTASATLSPAEDVELAITGMTCASCAARIEQKLNGLDGVTATVNYATERARVRLAPSQRRPVPTIGELLTVVEQAGYGAAVGAPARTSEGEGDRSVAVLRRRLLVSATLTVPIVVMSMAPPLQFAYWQWVSLALAIPVVLWGGWPFHRATWTNLRHGTTTMDTLVSLGTLAAFGWSLYALLLGSAGKQGMTHPFTFDIGGSDATGNIYFEVAAGVTTFLLAGRYAESRSKRRAGAAMRSLLDLGAKDVRVLSDAAGGPVERMTDVEDLVVGDRFVVRPGERIAADGEVEEGRATIDAAMLTGEPTPVDVAPGDVVVGATINLSGHLVVRATRVGADTQLAQMARLVQQAQDGKAAVQRLADRVSAVFVPVVVVFALTTLLGWALSSAGTASDGLSAAIAVLIVACACALGLATPTALMVGTGRGAQLGILIRGPEVLESTRAIDTIVLDKTGTLTSGRMSLEDVIAGAGEDVTEVLRMAGAVEQASEHPIGATIARSARERLGSLPAVSDFTALAGLGITARVLDSEPTDVAVGRLSWLSQREGPLTSDLAAAGAAAEARGSSAVGIAWGGCTRAVLVVSDTLKPTSAEAVGRLRAMGLTPVLLTGDNAGAAAHVARQVGIERVLAGVHPAAKAGEIERLQQQGRAHPGHDQRQPFLGLRLQRRSAPSGGIWLAQPDDCRRGNGVLIGLRGH